MLPLQEGKGCVELPSFQTQGNRTLKRTISVKIIFIYFFSFSLSKNVFHWKMLIIQYEKQPEIILVLLVVLALLTKYNLRNSELSVCENNLSTNIETTQL